MEMESIPKTAVLAVVGVLLIVTFAIPLLSSMETTSPVTGVNTTAGKASLRDSFELTEADGAVYLDGERWTDLMTAGAYSVIVTNKAIIKAGNNGASPGYYCDNHGTGARGTCHGAKLENGTLTITLTASTITLEGVTVAYVPDKDGSYGYRNLTNGITIVNKDQPLIQYSTSSSSYGVILGTATDRIQQFWYTTEGAVDYDDSLTMDTVEMGRTTLYGITAGQPFTSYIPVEYTYYETGPMGGAIGSIIGIMPIILIAGLVLCIMGAVAWRREHD